ncbi:MAG: hypothetical protein MJZ25_02465 [Fibrobacter sp.]|nr:hypothetical protein [Fibrobacter sp.]
MKSINFKTITTLSAIAMAGVFSACGDTSPTQGAGVSIDEDGVIADNNISSDSQEPSSSESGPLGSSDSQVPGSSSSSAFKPEVSSSSIYIPPVIGCKTKTLMGCAFTTLGDHKWDADEGYKIDTGMDNGTKTSGYWYEYNDNVDGGKSYIEWPAAKGNDYHKDAMDNIIDYCMGVCGTAHFDKGTVTYDPFVGIGFNLVGEDEKGNVQSGDITGWTKICIHYSSDISAELQLGFTDEYTKDSLGFDVPKKGLQKSSSGKQICYDVDSTNFRQDGWGIKQPWEEILKNVTSINIKFSDKSGTEAKFDIISIGWYGEGKPNN